MNILITGGTGLIGSAFIHQFDDHQYTVLTRSPAHAKIQLPAYVQLIDSLERLDNLDNFDAVINLAGAAIIDKRWSDKRKQEICTSRWQMTEQLVALFAHSTKPPAVFLSGSAIGVYGQHGNDELTEDSTVQETDFPTKLCLHWEEIARRAEPYTRVVLLRTGIVLAPKGGALAKMLLAFKLCLGGRIGSGQQYMSWIHYQDHIHAMHYLLSASNLSGPVNLVAPNPQTNRQFTQALAKALGRIAIFPVPKQVLQLLLGESACLLLDSQKVLPKKLLNSGFQFEYPHLATALNDAVRRKNNQS
ncbi:MAG: TIGR01777 family oxidoreductase [Pseudomonas sp.]|nr:TIGR01777 family oxidoreductase [Pseudomonas sp.]